MKEMPRRPPERRRSRAPAGRGRLPSNGTRLRAVTNPLMTRQGSTGTESDRDGDFNRRDEDQTFLAPFRGRQHVWDKLTDKIFVQDTSHKCPTYVHKTPPCQGSCPSGEDIRGWLQIVRGMEKPPAGMDWQEYAFRRSTDANPFPSMMGRVCPAPCQDGCNRNELEDFVGINAVEQFIGDTAIEKGYRFEAAPADTGKRVAIIGGGPAGSGSRLPLAPQGPRRDHLRGQRRSGRDVLLRHPRLSRAARQAQCRDPAHSRHGPGRGRLNTKVGADVTVEQLEKEFDAVLWAIGCQSGRGLPFPAGRARRTASPVSPSSRPSTKAA
jgi:glutamate synthase (NADPH) small chain